MVRLATQWKSVGAGMGDGNEQSCENEKVESVLDLEALIVADLAIDKLFCGLYGCATQDVAK